MTLSVQDAPMERTPGIPDTDDIPEVVAPPGALAPLAVDQYAELLGALRILGRVIDGAFERLPEILEERLQALLARLSAPEGQLRPVEASALEHLCEALDGLKAGLVVSGAPYAVQIDARSPAGYVIHLTIERQDGAAFFQALAGMESWLASNNYTPVAP